MPHDLVLCDMPEMLDVLYRDVEAAERRIDIECYIFLSDEFGSGFAERLCAAVERGVKARVLYDPLGSHTGRADFYAQMCDKGVEFRPYRPFWPSIEHLKLAPRDHGRIFLVDDVAYTGGAAWAKPWAPKKMGGDGWHDINVRVRGPVVAEFDALYEQRWDEATGKSPKDFDTGDRYPDLRLVGDTPRTDDSLVYQTYVDRIERARRRIWIANAYFVPPPPMVRALFAAAARGVDVQVLVPGVSDLGIMRRAARAEYRRWLGAGLRLFEYQSIMMHSKMALVDDDWCTVGTFNANSSSLGAANEINLFIYEPAFVERCAAQYRKDLGHAVEITTAMAEDRGFVEQAVDQLANDVLAFVDWTVGPSG